MTNISAATGITTRDGRLNWSRCVCALVCGRRSRNPESKVARQQTARKPSPRAAPVERAPVFFHDKTVITPVFERANLSPADG